MKPCIPAIHDGPTLTVQLGVSPESFTDKDGDVFSASAWMDASDASELVELHVEGADGDNVSIHFFKEDAAKIISLIAEAAAK
jgi:hypothetical protein